MIGSKGSGPGQFLNSAGLAVDAKENVYVPDAALHRITVFSRDGALLRTIANSEGTLIFSEGPGGVAVDAHGNLYAPDGKALVKLSPGGEVLARWE